MDKILTKPFDLIKTNNLILSRISFSPVSQLLRFYYSHFYLRSNSYEIFDCEFSDALIWYDSRTNPNFWKFCVICGLTMPTRGGIRCNWGLCRALGKEVYSNIHFRKINHNVFRNQTTLKVGQ